jgi:hypothetical protein
MNFETSQDMTQDMLLDHLNKALSGVFKCLDEKDEEKEWRDDYYYNIRLR